jgi:hypothetical protein
MGAVETERAETGRATLLPDPEPRAIRMPIISVDDHLIEPPDLFENRLPAVQQEDAPHVVEQDDGTQCWLFEGNRYPNVGLNAVVGRPPEEYGIEPTSFEEMRPGCYDINERVRDMNANGTSGAWSRHASKKCDAAASTSRPA